MYLKVHRTDEFGRHNDWTLGGRFSDQAIRGLGQQMAIAKSGFFEAQGATLHGPTHPNSLLGAALTERSFLRPLSPPFQPQDTSKKCVPDWVP